MLLFLFLVARELLVSATNKAAVSGLVFRGVCRALAVFCDALRQHDLPMLCFRPASGEC
jgi:hypothetical protein